ncbi:hypothetical protein V6U77_17905 [Micromonospora sp. CPCC 205546]|uniref:hypothetical protein n=1 Tax=Micromonospora sp. CPCC 205546 TaxID=3122397 RepID=UPI002FEF0EAA
MPSFYIMALGLVPDGEAGGAESCRLIPRAWGVAIFDWALLATQHKMHVPYQLADSYANSCNLEFRVKADTADAAVQSFRSITVALLASGVAPFGVPMVSTHSINDFSNISGAACDENDPRHGQAKRIASKEEVVEIWPAATSSGGMAALGATRRVSAKLVAEATREAELWRDLVKKQPVLHVLEDTILSVPQTTNMGQGILQMWTGLESLFPKVQSEVSFKLALYLAQLQGASKSRLAYFNKAKKAYNIRSKIAHGGSLRDDTEQNREKWSSNWALLIDAYKAILVRRGLPDEEELIAELLRDADEAGGDANPRPPSGLPSRLPSTRPPGERAAARPATSSGP